MNPALINFSADFITHPDKISAREFEASVSLTQDRASRPKHGIKWIQAHLPSWMQFFRNKFGGNVEEDAKSRVGEKEAYQGVHQCIQNVIRGKGKAVV